MSSLKTYGWFGMPDSLDQVIEKRLIFIIFLDTPKELIHSMFITFAKMYLVNSDKDL